MFARINVILRSASWIVRTPGRWVAAFIPQVRWLLGNPDPRGAPSSAESRRWPIHGTRLPRLDGLDVLVADDAHSNRLLLGRALEAYGATVRLVEDGAKAYQEVQRRAPQLVLMDIHMPVMDGCEATRRLRQEGFKSPILACTAQALPAELERCLIAGCDAVVAKPINVSELIQTVCAYTTGAASAPTARESSRAAGV